MDPNLCSQYTAIKAILCVGGYHLMSGKCLNKLITMQTNKLSQNDIGAYEFLLIFKWLDDMIIAHAIIICDINGSNLSCLLSND